MILASPEMPRPISNTVPIRWLTIKWLVSLAVVLLTGLNASNVSIRSRRPVGYTTSQAHPRNDPKENTSGSAANMAPLRANASGMAFEEQDYTLSTAAQMARLRSPPTKTIMASGTISPATEVFKAIIVLAPSPPQPKDSWPRRQRMLQRQRQSQQ